MYLIIIIKPGGSRGSTNERSRRGGVAHDGRVRCNNGLGEALGDRAAKGLEDVQVLLRVLVADRHRAALELLDLDNLGRDHLAALDHLLLQFQDDLGVLLGELGLLGELLVPSSLGCRKTLTR